MYSQLASIVFSRLKNSTAYYVNTMESTKEIISRLKFIGCLKKGEKINTRHMYVQPDGLSTKFSRTFIYQDNRGNALSFVQETINRAFELLISYERSNVEAERIMYYNLVKDLNQAKTGLKNLKDTYIEDTKFCCDMNTTLQFIDAKLQNKIENYLGPSSPKRIPAPDNHSQSSNLLSQSLPPQQIYDSLHQLTSKSLSPTVTQVESPVRSYSSTPEQHNNVIDQKEQSNKKNKKSKH
jgi:hypothetical protein